jgi:hypothetical protein
MGKVGPAWTSEMPGECYVHEAGGRMASSGRATIER